MSQPQTSDVDDHTRPPNRSRSDTSSSLKERRPKSRTSTTSLQSVDVGNSFQPQSHSVPPEQQQQYMHMQPHPGQVPIQAHGAPTAMVNSYQQHMPSQVPYAQPHMDPNHGVAQHDMRPVSQQGFHDNAYAMPFNGMPQYQPHMQHFRRQSEHYEGSPAPEDSNNENKRRKGTASTLANDQELRRLLQQHQGKSLKEVAQEVQKTEGHNGGKAEKAKQVFAMLWLRESCVRSSSSVRRDRVFARYTERCGGERVPTLNPASFGKLVRIIFPNVQTRRLGVRGESKYHYVDLSLVANDDDERMYAANTSLSRPATAGGAATDTDGPTDSKTHQPRASTLDGRPNSRHSMETADFPAPSNSLPPPSAPAPVPDSQPSTNQSYWLDCQYHNTPTIQIPTKGQTNNLVAALPKFRPNAPGCIATYLAMPSPHLVSQQESSGQDAPVELPDIAPYLVGVEHDADIAKSLFHLYRSYCTDVIDSFRKCREKNFFNHHSAFNGKMTVPVSKLFTLECLAPWIQECDMRMYKQIAKFTAPLVLQNVPDMVWGVFERVAVKLVQHIINSFEEKCPVHVVVAKTVPAARFANLLKKLKTANTATLQMSRLLEDGNTRTQMWLDLLVMVTPETVLDSSNPPMECLSSVKGVLKHDLRTLLDPLHGPLTTAAEEDPTSTYVGFLNDPSGGLPGVLSFDVLDQPMALLDKWISWLQCLPETFEGHHPQCMLGWHKGFWDSILAEVGNNGATSFQAWWYAKTFAVSLLSWMAEMQGLLMCEADQKLMDAREMEKMQQHLSSSTSSNPGKRKRDADDSNAWTSRPAKRHTSYPLPGSIETTHIHATARSSALEARSATVEPTLPELPQTADSDETDAEMDELRRGGPLHLPSIGLGFHTGLTSPLKMSKTPMRAGVGGVNDDSGIDLGLDIDMEAEKEAKKFRKADWLVSLSSDPVDGAGMGSGVIV
ncbi:uncharacterized protein HMPREF1541_04667 [Cyphellophora europaea CBS 101466]|uniref:RFX-type winged-helix domain-containing protein n=1 Tax=Cyphellophora europaea (strain CBS 101466) TaxID=1220924 RepID=W2RVR7_CYPE1|nr:uncharacterized protein HMPREF1541_04667 [Cyphellophora europaea CBS 101466]ETN40390.1 hypothetical protein HMPREF1541_04667 [Cyphellophora europaea CBS 101466]